MRIKGEEHSSLSTGNEVPGALDCLLFLLMTSYQMCAADAGQGGIANMLDDRGRNQDDHIRLQHWPGSERMHRSRAKSRVLDRRSVQNQYKPTESWPDTNWFGGD